MCKSMILILSFALLYLDIQAQCPPAKNTGYHVVQKGETLYRISKTYNITVDQLRQWNNLQPSDPIRVCQELKVAATAQPVSNTTAVNVSATAQGKSEHIVRPGETVESIANAYGYTVERFRKFNQLQPGEKLQAGRVLKTSDCICPSLASSDPATSTVSNYDQKTTTATQGEIPASYETNLGNTSVPVKSNNGFTKEEQLLRQQESERQPTASRPITVQRTVSVPKAVAPFMMADEVAMVDEINLVRFDPASYAAYIEAYLEEVRSGRAYGSIETCQELIRELKGMAPLPTLEPSECLYSAARKHVESQRSGGTILHLGKDGSYPWDRIRRECPDMTDGNENIVAGPGSVRQAVILLLVDEGIPDRGHRRTLLNKDWKFVACVKAGQVGTMPNNWVQEFGR